MPGRDPLERALGQLVKETALGVVARLAVQHARLRVAQIQPLARAGDGHVHQAALFFDAAPVAQGVLVGKQAVFQAADEHGVKLQPLAGVHGHQLHRVLPGLGLVIARLQRGVGQKCGQRREGFARVHIHHAGHGGARQGRVPQRRIHIQTLAGGALRERRAVLVQRQGHGIAAKALQGDKALGGVEQFVQIFQPILAFFVGFVMRD